MRLLCLGDIHHRASAPRGRKDDYVRTHQEKMEQIGEIADKYGCTYVLAPGDVFDKAVVPFWLINWCIRHYWGGGFLAVLGQHDQRYHNADREDTPLGTLEASRVARVLGPMPYVDAGVEFYGASWGQDIPKPRAGDAVKVLLTHRMIIHNKKLWEAQKEFDWSSHILKRNQFDLIVSGDNHQFFTEQVGDRFLVNCGSVMRSGIDQVNHRPAVVMYDTEERTTKVIHLKVAPADEILRIEEAAEIKNRNDHLEAFVEKLGNSEKDPDLDFLTRLTTGMKKEEVSKGVQVKIREIVGMSLNELGSE